MTDFTRHADSTQLCDSGDGRVVKGLSFLGLKTDTDMDFWRAKEICIDLSSCYYVISHLENILYLHLFLLLSRS